MVWSSEWHDEDLAEWLTKERYYGPSGHPREGCTKETCPDLKAAHYTIGCRPVLSLNDDFRIRLVTEDEPS